MINTQHKLMERLRDRDVIKMDGALGTELERRGVPIEGEAWSAVAVAQYGDVIKEIHKDYIRAGAELHIVNSFALARHVLEPVGLGDQFEYLNRRSVGLFDQAADDAGVSRDHLFAAGSLSTFAANSDRTLLPGIDILERNYKDQAEILFDAGVDLFALEMLFDVEVSMAMVRAVEEFGLPVIVGFTSDWERRNGVKVPAPQRMGHCDDSLERVITEVVKNISSENTVLAIMHSEIDVTHAALEVVKNLWQGPIAIYPNSGEFDDLRMQFDTVCEASQFEEAAQIWIDDGVNIIGGCCGIGPSHIRALWHN